jgi:hypothetical protein
VTQKTEPLLERFAAAIGVGKIRSYPARKGASAGCTLYFGGKDAMRVAVALWPYLGERKKSDFKRALRMVRESRDEVDALLQPEPRVCAADDCDNVFTPDRRHDQAAYCSHRCWDRISARVRRGPAPPRFCRGCGCEADSRTRGCRRCMTRHWERKRRAEGVV